MPKKNLGKGTSLPPPNSGNVQKFHDFLVGRCPDKRILHHCSVWYLVNFQLGAALYLLVLGTWYLVLGACECKDREKWTLMLLLSKRVVVARINKRVVALVINQIIATFLGAL